MTSPFDDLEVDDALRPQARRCGFDLNRALSSVLVLEAEVPPDATTAKTLGAERVGNAVVIGEDGLVLTIGYLVLEAEAVILTTAEGRRVPAHVLGVDGATGFGLLHALDPLRAPSMALGDSRRVSETDPVIVAGGGGGAHAVAAQILARGPFAGYWEYFLEEAIFTAPAHPHWSGAALIGPRGELMGMGSLLMEQGASDGERTPVNMCVPIELLPPILDDLSRGRPQVPARPWLGVYAQDAEVGVVVLDVAPQGPAARAELRRGDLIRAVGGRPISGLAEFYQRLWALGAAGVGVPLTLQREREVFEVEVRSQDRAASFRRRRFN